jgi:hypothetical protein
MRAPFKALVIGLTGLALGGLALPAPALAATYRFVGENTSEAFRSGKTITGYQTSNGAEVGWVDFWSAPGGEVVRHLFVCDEASDGQPVYGRVQVTGGRTIDYKAPAATVPGRDGVIGCEEYLLYYADITLFRMVVGSTQSGSMGPPERQ